MSLDDLSLQLKAATISRDAERCAMLVKQGADPFLCDGFQGASALHLAIRPRGRRGLSHWGIQTNEEALTCAVVKALLTGISTESTDDK